MEVGGAVAFADAVVEKGNCEAFGGRITIGPGERSRGGGGGEVTAGHGSATRGHAEAHTDGAIAASRTGDGHGSRACRLVGAKAGGAELHLPERRLLDGQRGAGLGPQAGAARNVA